MKHLATALTVTAVLVLSGCGDDSTTSTADTTAAAAASTTVASGATTSPPDASGGGALQLAKTSLGKVLVDGDGMTLYLFTPDSATKSACNGGCAAAWPPVAGPVTGDGLDAEDLGTVTRDDGTVQATFYGHPLYRYAEDTKAGDVLGEGSAGKWYAIDADGNPVEESADKPTTTAAASGY